MPIFFRLLVELVFGTVFVLFGLAAFVTGIWRICDARRFGFAHSLVTQRFVFFVVFDLRSVVLCHDNVVGCASMLAGREMPVARRAASTVLCFQRIASAFEIAGAASSARPWSVRILSTFACYHVPRSTYKWCAKELRAIMD